MTVNSSSGPSRGRLYKLFTDLGPYFRRQSSTDSTFFFDCLEICVDDNKEPEEREFLGWSMLVTLDETGFRYQRFDGIYNLAGNWVAYPLDESQKIQIDKAFELFLTRLSNMLEVEASSKLIALEEVSLTEA
ncbi:sigma factor-binding protein Crl [Psychromonas sp. MME2]|uniref:sigma factor-binding protein Crl n=1 Tax=unclassified Psychromonas TaxID=2614957 RepID=UPI00339C66CE